jgi:2'-5' RNA ligase
MAADEHARLFIALDIPDAVRDAVEVWQVRACDDPAIRPVAAENLHLTLCFLGSVHLGQMAEVAATVVNQNADPVSMRFTGVSGRPLRRPGVIALEVESSRAAKLQATLASELAVEGLYAAEHRPFWPHLTVARVRNESGKRRPQRLGRRPEELPDELMQPFDAVRLALYRSNIRSDRSHYVSLAELNLPPSA